MQQINVGIEKTGLTLSVKGWEGRPVTLTCAWSFVWGPFGWRGQGLSNTEKGEAVKTLRREALGEDYRDDTWQLQTPFDIVAYKRFA